MLPLVTLNNSNVYTSMQRVQPVQLREIPSNKTETEREELEKNLELNNLNNNTVVANDASSVDSIGSVTSTSEVSQSGLSDSDVSQAKPERLRFDTYEPSERMPSAGIYEPVTDKNSSRTISFDAPEQTMYANTVPELDKQSYSNVNNVRSEVNKPVSGMLYEIPEQEAAKVAPSNLSVNTDRSSDLDERSLLKTASDTRANNLNDVNIPQNTESTIAFGSDKEKTRVDMLNDELSKAAQQMNLINKSSVSEVIFS